VNPKHLAIYLGCALVIYGVVMCLAANRRTRQSNQMRNNLGQVNAHLALIRPQWEAFRQTNGGLECVRIRATYHAEGSLEVYGPATSQVQVAQALQFVRDTHPPRPLWTNALRVDRDAYLYYRAEPDGAANRSQPVQAETNRTSAAAGSGR
jgi:glycine cleavage system aminomethyltransferase T